MSQPRTQLSEVEKSFGKTYKWVFSNQVTFSKWLCEKGGGSIYWIQGKPGSGKSTLMKFILRHQTTPQLLLNCHNSRWIRAGFFFHDRGMELQKSLNGLLYEMLYQILRQEYVLLSLIVPLFSERVRPRRTLLSLSSESPWYTEDLQEALLLIVNQKEIKLKCVLLHRRAR
jgi:hypothetical protein